MFGKTTFLLAAVAAIANVVVATPPACMLGAVNTYKTPSDISAVCKSKDMTGTIAKMCGDGASDALSAFADICNKAGVKVATELPSGTVSASASAKPTGAHNSTSIIVYTTASFDSACSCTKTAAVTSQVVAVATSGLVAATGTGGSPTGATKTPTGTGAPQSTGAAGKNGVGLSAAALLAGLGVMAAAL
ncbi:hypothetical protein BCR34DRAFT_573080 [Clohesyomyces aquaticus]|uniref:GPI anchored cell wall protein n=1 Tax=Clohesyomyces aquaticus TaxID=1231657 RepID=A0A1Y1Z280_9PLEO|nr:hypothetical protein BCR34DRAFT_573080 [Clohesyomyces aquaticus]